MAQVFDGMWLNFMACELGHGQMLEHLNVRSFM